MLIGKNTLLHWFSSTFPNLLVYEIEINSSSTQILQLQLMSGAPSEDINFTIASQDDIVTIMFGNITTPELPTSEIVSVAGKYLNCN